VGERRLVIANRGLAGIDGVLSSAIGAALARPSSRAIAYVGDLTFLHGSNGLLIGPGEPRPDLTIVVASDDGGSIFSTLEQGAPAYAASFERVFATPTGADLGALCAGYGVPHRLVSSAELATVLAEDVTGVRVVEVPVDRAGRRELDARIAADVRAELRC
jgi:2-succinyl-5-enolpyruvyl-6-hydroxy-3-cyclohexene-1-carboxylate synthase